VGQGDSICAQNALPLCAEIGGFLAKSNVKAPNPMNDADNPYDSGKPGSRGEGCLTKTRSIISKSLRQECSESARRRAMEAVGALRNVLNDSANV